MKPEVSCRKGCGQRGGEGPSLPARHPLGQGAAPWGTAGSRSALRPASLSSSLPAVPVIEVLMQVAGRASRPCGQRGLWPRAVECSANFPLRFCFSGSGWPCLNVFPLCLAQEGAAAAPQALGRRGTWQVLEGSVGSWVEPGSAGTRRSPPEWTIPSVTVSVAVYCSQHGMASASTTTRLLSWLREAGPPLLSHIPGVGAALGLCVLSWPAAPAHCPFLNRGAT